MAAVRASRRSSFLRYNLNGAKAAFIVFKGWLSRPRTDLSLIFDLPYVSLVFVIFIWIFLEVFFLDLVILDCIEAFPSFSLFSLYFI